MKGLLSDLRVVEIATFVFAPGAGTVLSDFGAEVFHIEQPGIGDPYRKLSQLRPLPESDENYCWDLDSRNKKSVVIDLKSDQGQIIIKELLQTTDVLITNYHPSVLTDLKLSYEEVRNINQKIIFAHATGYGELGNECEKPGYDATAWWARSGMMDLVRSEGSELALATPAMGDHPSSLSLLSGIMMALYARKETHKGTKVSSSLMGNGAWANSILIQAALSKNTRFFRTTQSNTPNALVNHYLCSDDRSFFLGLIKEEAEFPMFCDAIERPDLKIDKRFAEIEQRRSNSLPLVQLLNEWFKQKPLSFWEKKFDEKKITYGRINTVNDLISDKQMLDNNVFLQFDGHPKKKVVNSPFEIRGYPKPAPKLPPSLGADTRSLLTELGYGNKEINMLEAQNIVITEEKES